MRSSAARIVIFGVCLLIFGVCFLASNCRPDRQSPDQNPKENAASFLLITIDTLRADHLGCYGRVGARTPVIDRLAREGTLFQTAITPLPRTTPAIASLMTALSPPHHRVRGLKSLLSDDLPTLAGWQHARGRRTGGFTSNIWLRPATGLGRDFEAYSNPRSRWSGNSAREVTDEALEWISKLAPGEPFFLWVHYLDPHWTYAPAPPYDKLYDPDFKGPWPYGDVKPGEAGQGPIIFKNTMTPREVAHAIALYDGEIAATDAEVGRLLEGLSRSPGQKMDRTLVVLTSDHGESLGEHDYFFDHGEYLYDGTLLVPLIFRWPGHVPAGKVVHRMARLTDVAPTALALLGDPLPSGIDGRSLAGDVTEATTAATSPLPATPALPASEESSKHRAGSSAFGNESERECWIESDHNYVRRENPRHFVKGIEGKWRGIRGERYKLIFVPRDTTGIKGDVELYDIVSDPEEKHDLSREQPDVTSELLDRLRRYWSKNGSAAAPPSEGPPPDVEIIKSLGYGY